MAGRWQHVPERAYKDPRFLALGARPASSIWLRLWLGCDRWGRGDADEWALRQALGVMDGTEVRPLLDELAASGLVRVYEVDGRAYWELPGYGEDGPRDVTRNRAQSMFPADPSVTCPDSSQPPPDASGCVRTNPDQHKQEQEHKQDRRVDTRATLSPGGDTWPPGTEEAGKAYLAKQIATANAMGRTTTIAPSTVRLIAQRHPDTFALAAIGLVELADTKPECMTASPHKWLLQRCESPPAPKAKPPPKLEARQCGPAPEPSPEWLINWRGAEVSPEGVAQAEVLAGPSGYYKREERPPLREHPEALAWVCEQYGWRPEEVAA